MPVPIDFNDFGRNTNFTLYANFCFIKHILFGLVIFPQKERSIHKQLSVLNDIILSLPANCLEMLLPNLRNISVAMTSNKTQVRFLGDGRRA